MYVRLPCRSLVLGPTLIAASLAAGDATAESPLVRVVDGRGEARTDSQIEPCRVPPTRRTTPGVEDGVRLEVETRGARIEELELVSFDAASRRLDGLRVPAVAQRCVGERPRSCASTLPLRFVTDLVDRDHPLARARSLLVDLGGELVVRSADRELARLPVRGPRLGTSVAEALGARLRFVLVRTASGGAPPIGVDRGSARALLRSTVSRASAVWASCGFVLHDPERFEVELVDPPPSHLVAVGCSHGLPASGGELRLSVDGHRVTASIRRGATPSSAARVLVDALHSAGFSAEISDNPRIASAALSTTDVLVRRADGTIAEVTPPPRADVAGAFDAASTDATLDVCVGTVDLGDGLQHFGDVDSAAGSLEERTMIKAFDDRDPTTIDVYVVPGFAKGGRIGESFIRSDRGSLSNAIVIDRAGLRGERAPLTLAHELGHVLLDEPGHPDDFAADTPSFLMDANSSDLSAFGPRRLTLAECRRALAQSGPRAEVRVLRPRPAAPR
ncbi:MAG: hypothetical protein FJ096_13595 [Deltaproteobacteria bacterium]|nr:hypothetical protein [Deltaproteobacteria bacterium]